jgi:hypothetical protein
VYGRLSARKQAPTAEHWKQKLPNTRLTPFAVMFRVSAKMIDERIDADDACIERKSAIPILNRYEFEGL